jgi:two-component system, NtrC family, nitrogen regulation sensor histidine kinase GlnL
VTDPQNILAALPHPVIAIEKNMKVGFANASAEEFFGMSLSAMQRRKISDLFPFGSPVIELIERSMRNSESFNEYGLDFSIPPFGHKRIVDLQVAPSFLSETPEVIIVIQLRSIAHKIDQQLTHRGAARSVSAMAAMLAHEIKNPLSGIRGAAQLLELDVPPEGAELTQLICDETSRIAALVDQFEVFSDISPPMDQAVNVHAVLDHVRRLANAGFARNIRFVEDYDPSLPDVLGDKNMLTQVFLNLVKNAAEALTHVSDPQITLSSAFKPGVRLSFPGRARRVSLPLEFTVIDNGPGVPDHLRPHLFDPFVTTKSSGSGLGLAMVAKIIGDHGGVVECDSQQGKTVFRILLPMAQNIISDENSDQGLVGLESELINE